MRLISSICAIENMGIPAGSTGTEVAGGICTRALKALISAIMSAIVVIVAAVSCALGSTGAACDDPDDGGSRRAPLAWANTSSNAGISSRLMVSGSASWDPNKINFFPNHT
jgi:hypothetical protein